MTDTLSSSDPRSVGIVQEAEQWLVDYSSGELVNDGANLISALKSDLQQLQATNARLNRRCQTAEAAANLKVEDWGKRSTGQGRAYIFQLGKSAGEAEAQSRLSAVEASREHIDQRLTQAYADIDAWVVKFNATDERAQQAQRDADAAHIRLSAVEAERDWYAERFKAADELGVEHVAEMGELMRQLEDLRFDLQVKEDERHFEAIGHANFADRAEAAKSRLSALLHGVEGLEQEFVALEKSLSEQAFSYELDAQSASVLVGFAATLNNYRIQLTALRSAAQEGK